MNEYISAEEQRLTIEKLYRSNDSITSTNKLNKQYGLRLGQAGMKLTDFGRKMKQTKFSSYDVERFTKEITGKNVDLESL
ncbi:hypothetical protein K8R42_01520 [bacterium]|nr:hypothetical protein [bacterium]